MSTPITGIACTVCGKPESQHGTYPTCATHPLTADGRCGAAGTMVVPGGKFVGEPCPGAECVNGCVRAKATGSGS